jgi:septum formation protein
MSSPLKDSTRDGPRTEAPRSPVSHDPPQHRSAIRLNRHAASRLPRLVLASQSPRRRSLLDEAGIEHEALHPGVDDGLLSPGTVSPEQWVKALAYYKAAAGAALVRDAQDAIIIGADTVCVKDGEILGQPIDLDDARRMLHRLENGSHAVITGVAILPMRHGAADSFDREIFVDRAIVHVAHLGPERIDEYLATGAWKGKAGAYNLSERIDAGWPIHYEGDPSTIMGLPIGVLVARLERIAGSFPPEDQTSLGSR